MLENLGAELSLARVFGKKIIFKYQKKIDFLVLNEDDQITREFAKETNSEVKFYSADKLTPKINFNN